MDFEFPQNKILDEFVDELIQGTSLVELPETEKVKQKESLLRELYRMIGVTLLNDLQGTHADFTKEFTNTDSVDALQKQLGSIPDLEQKIFAVMNSFKELFLAEFKKKLEEDTV